MSTKTAVNLLLAIVLGVLAIGAGYLITNAMGEAKYGQPIQKEYPISNDEAQAVLDIIDN